MWLFIAKKRHLRLGQLGPIYNLNQKCVCWQCHCPDLGGVLDADDLFHKPIIHWWQSVARGRLKLQLEWLQTEKTLDNIMPSIFNAINLSSKLILIRKIEIWSPGRNYSKQAPYINGLSMCSINYFTHLWNGCLENKLWDWSRRGVGGFHVDDGDFSSASITLTFELQEKPILVESHNWREACWNQWYMSMVSK